MLKAVADHQSKQTEETPQDTEPDFSISTDSTPRETNHTSNSDSYTPPMKSPKTSPHFKESLAEVMSNGSTGSFGVLATSEESVKEFESPKLER